MNWIKNEELRLKTKRTFLKQGTSSRTFFHILNREYNNPKPSHENALDPLADPEIEKIFKAFYAVTDYEMECSQICGRKFTSLADHSNFISNGGCKNLIDALVNQ